MSKPTFILIANADLPRVQEEIRKTVEQLGEACSGKLLEGVSIATGQTAVPHRLGRIPFGAFLEPRADARVWRSQAPDATNVYYTASAAVTCNVWVF